MSLETHRPAAPRAQAPKSEKSAHLPSLMPEMDPRELKRREFSSLARRHRKEERDRRSESQWRKRTCALMLGMFKEAEPDPVTGRRYTDEAALDAFAPHGSERIEDRYFTADMETREREAWQVVEAAKLEGGAKYLAACRNYLRLVAALDTEAIAHLLMRVLIGDGTRARFSTFKGMAGRPKLKGAMRIRRAM